MKTVLHITEDIHNELLQAVGELLAYVESGYAEPSDIFTSRLKRINEILWENYKS